MMALLLHSCEEITRKDVVGHYQGTRRFYDYNPVNGITVNAITSSSFSVSKSGRKEVEIMDHHFPVDSLRDGYTQFLSDDGTGGNYIMFKEDSIIVYFLLKYKAGYHSFIEYRALKEEK